MSGYVPPTDSPYARGTGSGPDELPWQRVLARVVLVVVPGQVLGALLATLMVVPVDLRAHPHVTALFWVVPGLLAGVGLALFLLRPAVRRPWRVVGFAAAVAVVSLLLLTFLGQARGGVSPSLTWSLVGGLVGNVAIQTAVASGLWFVRRRRAGA